MAKSKRVAETSADYRTVVADLQQPLVLEQDGQPIAVLIPYKEYHRLQVLASDEAQRQRTAWHKVGKIVEAIHNRPTEYIPNQIEAEITTARIEVREKREANRRRD